MAITQATSSVLAANAALNNLNAGANITFTKTLISPTISTPTIAQINGSTSSGGSLTLQSTTNATKGLIRFGNSAYDEVNNALLIGTTTYETGKFLDLNFNISSGGRGMRIRNSNNLGFSELVFDNDTTPTGIGAFVFGYGGTATTNPNQGYFWNRRNAEILFGTNNNERMRILGNGNIAIGTTSAAERLTVSGNISATGTIIASNYNPATSVAAFLSAPTSANLAAAVTDETGTGSLVFGTSPNFSGTPKINSNWIPQTLYKDGIIPVPQIFEDFHQGGNGSSTIGANNWTSSGLGGSNGQWTISSSSTTTRAWGMQFFTTGATSGNTRSLTLGPAGGQIASTCVGASFQTCFSLLSATNFQYFNGFTGGGAGPGVSLSGIGVGATQLILTGPGITNVVLLSGLTINTGNFGFGTRYRLFYRCISTTQSEVYFASAPFDSATWTTIYDNPAINHGTLSLGFGCSIPVLSIVTLEGVAKTTYVDWASVIWDQQR